MLQVLAKDCYPETYVPTVFENYTASLELEEQRVELSLWDTSGSPYYDNVRPLCYSDSDAVLLCFDVSRPDAADSALRKWKTEILDFCPSTRVLLVGCKTDLRTDVCTLLELSNQKLTPVSQEQGVAMAKQLGAEPYLECSAFTSEKSVHSIFEHGRPGLHQQAAGAGQNQPRPPPLQETATPAQHVRAAHLHLPQGEGQELLHHVRRGGATPTSSYLSPPHLPHLHLSPPLWQRGWELAMTDSVTPPLTSYPLPSLPIPPLPSLALVGVVSSVHIRLLSTEPVTHQHLDPSPLRL
ncbi:hypothetical protein GJAV_G00185520 [Gymnothorax javanicus]|nr:hypothetical protein GJAV_G00185520 [Gymnothorax javanicus]